jgi:excinuclease UvrABC helicase subunit UvrB
VEELDTAIVEQMIEEERKAMETAAKALDFMTAAKHRDRMQELRKIAERLKK